MIDQEPAHRPDRDQLTEALAEWDEAQADSRRVVREDARPGEAIIAAARWARDFPTDEMVRVAAATHYGVHFEDDERMMRKTLEAVRQTMIGDNQP
jgi:hypothetical protein